MLRCWLHLPHLPKGVLTVRPLHSMLLATRPALLDIPEPMYLAQWHQARVWPLPPFSLGTCVYRLRTGATDVHVLQTSHHQCGSGGTWGTAYFLLSDPCSLHSPIFPAPTSAKQLAVLPMWLPSPQVTAAPPEVGIATPPLPPPLALVSTWARCLQSLLN